VNPWILVRHVRDRKIPFSPDDGYGTVKRARPDHTEHSDRRRENYEDEDDSPLFLPTSEARNVLPSVGDKLVIHMTHATETGANVTDTDKVCLVKISLVLIYRVSY